MKKRNNKAIILLFVGILLTCFIALYMFHQSVFPSNAEDIVSYQEKNYTFDVNNILSGIKDGRKDIFIETPEESSFISVSPIQWTQEDYLKVSKSLTELFKAESLDKWYLHSMFFRVDCPDVDNGPQYASFEFFKTTSGARYVLKIFVDPRSELITISHTVFSPLVYNWKYIDLENVKVDAKDALSISEQNGGESTRLSYDNNCRIFETLAPDSLINGWRVLYSAKDQNTPVLIDFYINEKNSDFEVINSTKE